MSQVFRGTRYTRSMPEGWRGVIDLYDRPTRRSLQTSLDRCEGSGGIQGTYLVAEVHCAEPY